jgi:lysozyme
MKGIFFIVVLLLAGCSIQPTTPTKPAVSLSMMDTKGAATVATAFIAAQEEFSPLAYFDVNGYAVGYGNHYYKNGSAVKKGDRITKQAADSLLLYWVTQDLKELTAELKVNQNPRQLAALTSIKYNCGTITETLLKLINSGAMPGAVGTEIEKTCIDAGGKLDPELITRRKDEAALYVK